MYNPDSFLKLNELATKHDILMKSLSNTKLLTEKEQKEMWAEIRVLNQEIKILKEDVKESKESSRVDDVKTFTIQGKKREKQIKLKVTLKRKES